MSKINIEEIVKSKLDNYEMSYDNSWNEFEKKLNKSKVSYTKYYLAAAAAVVVGVLLFSYLHNNDVKDNTHKEVISHDINKSEKNVINSNEKLQITEVNNTKEKESVENNSDKNTSNDVISKQDDNETNETFVSNIENNTNNDEVSDNSEVVVDNNSNNNEDITANFKSNCLSGCEPLTVYFTPENTEKAEYTWKFSDGSVSNDKMPKHVFKNAGEYTVELIVKSKVTKEIINSIKEKYIIVNPNPKAIFTMTKDDNLYYFDCSDNYTDVKWKIDSKIVSTDIDPEYEFKTIGKSEITLVVENEFHCKADYSKTVDIEPTTQMANAFTPDNNGDNEFFGPVFENFDDYKYYLYIYDAYGKLVFKSNYANQAWNGRVLNSNSIAADGTYIWKLIIKDNFGNELTKKGQVALRK